MRKNYHLHFHDIIASISKIRRYTLDLSYAQFIQSREVQDAVKRDLELIERAGRQLPEEIKDAFPEIPWRLMKDIPNILAREHFGVDSEALWKTIQESLPPLLEALRKALFTATGGSTFLPPRAPVLH